jgi:hypothetical protein
MDNENKIKFVTVEESTTRADRRRIVEEEFDPTELANNMNRFLENLNVALEQTPNKVGNFEFVELEIYAEVSAKGTFKVLGTGVEAGGNGGLKFVFRRN